MIVNLYNYNGRSDALNKTKNLSPQQIDATLYGTFNPLAPMFYFGELYDANLCTFTFGGKTYVCTLDPAVWTKDGYSYSGSVDALNTAYANGCMDIENVIAYSRNGNGRLMADERAPKETLNTRYEQTFDESGRWTNAWAAVTILRPANADVQHSIIHNPMTVTYVMSLSARGDNEYSDFAQFLSKFYENEARTQVQYGRSVMAIQIVPAGMVDTIHAVEVHSFDLWAIVTESSDAPGVTLTIELGNNYKAYRLDDTLLIGQNNITLTTPFVINPDSVNANVSLYVQNVGTINFQPAQLGITGTITTVGYREYLDLTGHQVCANLVIDNVEYKYLSVSSQWTLAVPMFIDSSVTDFSRYASAGIAIAGGVIALIGGAVTGGMSTLAYVGASGAVLSGAVAMDQARLEARTGGNDILFTAGATGDLAFGRPSALIINHYESIDLDGYQYRYGKPDGESRNIQTLPSGYIQVNGARLLTKGLPRDIINEAEASLTDGCWKL